MSAISGNPWMIDAAAAISTDRLRILGFRWVAGATAGDQCIVTDAAGNVIWESVAAGADYVESDMFPAARMYKGLTVTTLDSGRLYVSLG